MSKRKNSNLFLYLLLSCLLINCKDKKTTDIYEVRDVNNRIIIKGQFENKKPDGLWSYYDQNGLLIKEMRYHHTHLENISFYNDSNLVYIERGFPNDIERISFGATEGYQGGKFILNSKCTTCHNPVHGLAIDLKTMIDKDTTLDELKFLNLYNRNLNGLDSMHAKIPLSKFEISDVLRYLKSYETKPFIQ